MVWKKHEVFETRTLALTSGILVVVAIGGIVEIAPLFSIQNTIERVEGMRPYSPLELAGRNIYVREGCYTCHSQQVRTLRDEVERYGHFSLAAESMYDHPFQWGSKRTGPDLARVGGKYSNEWHVQHLIDPRSVVPESIMPPYAFLQETLLDTDDIGAHLETLRGLGQPYTDEMIENARFDMVNQAAGEFDGDWAAVQERYPNAAVGVFDGDPARLTEMDALVAYLQILGQLVDFTSIEPEQLQQR
jgi:cytochrome c oxidase cbb3-type subunit 2